MKPMAEAAPPAVCAEVRAAGAAAAAAAARPLCTQTKATQLGLAPSGCPCRCCSRSYHSTAAAPRDWPPRCPAMLCTLQRLVKLALDRGTTDNTTAVVALLPGAHS